jgi:hypothetical protein
MQDWLQALPNVQLKLDAGIPQQAATASGIADRAHFEVRDAADPTIDGNYDLVLAIEMLHDVPDPVGILRTMRKLAGDADTVLVVDERTEEDFTVPTNEMERFFYASSNCTASRSACRMVKQARAQGQSSVPRWCVGTQPRRGSRLSRHSTWTNRSSFCTG